MWYHFFSYGSKRVLQKIYKILLPPGFQKLCSTLSILYVTSAQKYWLVYAPFVPTWLKLQYLFCACTHLPGLWRVFYKTLYGRSKPAVCNLLSWPQVLALSDCFVTLNLRCKTCFMLLLNVMARKSLIAESMWQNLYNILVGVLAFH